MVDTPNSGTIFGYDFQYLWCAGKLARDGGNPYTVEPFAECLYTVGWPTSEAVQAFTHPPHTFWFYGLLSCMPFHFSFWIWTVLSALVLVICGRYWLVYSARSDLKALVPLALLTVCFPPMLSTLIWGQVNAIHLLGVTGFAWLFRKDAAFASGLLISLTLTKPHLYVPLYGYLVAMLVHTRNWTPILGSVAGFALQVAASLLFFPEGPVFYYGRLASLSNEAGLIRGATLAQQLPAFTDFPFYGPFFAIVGLIIGAFAGLKDSPSLRLIPPVLCGGLILAPYNWSHGLVGTFPAFAPALVRLRQQVSERGFMATILIIVAVSLPFVVRAHTQIVWMLLPFVALVLWHRYRVCN